MTATSNRPRITEAYRKQVLDILIGHLWHTTHPGRFVSILEDEAILPEPDIPESDRWKTSMGPEYYPYVRKLGGVSLFDFNNFDQKNYSEKHRLCTWREFVPFQSAWGSAIWIEIDREAVKDYLISGCELLVRWKQEEAYHHTIMPYIEAAHIGMIPSASFSRDLLVSDSAIEVIPF